MARGLGQGFIALVVQEISLLKEALAYLRSLKSIAGCLVCLSGAVYMSYAGRAELSARSGQLSGLLAAAELTPGDSDLWRRAGLKLLEMDPVGARIYLEMAVRLNPRDADAILGLGFLSEKASNIDSSEQYYTAAARISRRFRPNYSLAAFYFREDRHSLFWVWAAKTASIGAANLETLFRMAHLISTVPNEIPTQLNLESQHSLTSYVGFLLREGGLENLANTAERIDATGPNRDLLLTACERLLDAGRTADAFRIWKRLDTGASALVNGKFLPAPMRGFNWRSSGASGVTVAMLEPSGFRIEFSGKQAESGHILTQPLRPLSGRKCQLRYRADISNLPFTDGLEWAVVKGNEVRARAAWSAGSPEGTFEFQPPAEGTSLVLRYERSLGTVRLRGSIILSAADLKCVM